jgi:zinc/manganese transport system substrate-binding protein
VADAAIYVANIRDGLIAVDPAGRGLYETNATTYLAELARLDADIRNVLTGIPADRRKVITTHDAFGYFGAAYGIAFIAAQGVSSETEPSARDIAAIITTIRRDRIPALFFESTVDPRLIRRIAAETGAGIGGTLYADSLAADGAAATYAGMMRHNAVTLADALRDGSPP